MELISILLVGSVSLLPLSGQSNGSDSMDHTPRPGRGALHSLIISQGFVWISCLLSIVLAAAMRIDFREAAYACSRRKALYYTSILQSLPGACFSKIAACRFGYPVPVKNAACQKAA